jgi:hypothetical protein
MSMGAGRDGQFPLVFGGSDVEREIKAALDGRRVWAGFVPLFSNATAVRSDLDVTYQGTTYAPHRGGSSGVGASTKEPSTASRVNADETRFMTLLGENRYEYSEWKVGEKDKTRYREQRLTADYCGGSAIHPDLDLGGTKEPCDANAAIPGTGWKVSDAYRVPATGGSAPWQDLTSVFSQEMSGKARVQLFLSGAAASWVSSLEIWSVDRYRARQPGDVADYRLAAPGQTTMRFCDSDSTTCLSTKAMDRYGRDADELPAGAYVVRAVIAAGHPVFHWGMGAWSYQHDDQRWAVAFNVSQRQEFLAAYRGRLAG